MYILEVKLCIDLKMPSHWGVPPHCEVRRDCLEYKRKIASSQKSQRWRSGYLKSIIATAYTERAVRNYRERKSFTWLKMIGFVFLGCD